MATTPDGIPIMSAREFSSIKNNPVQQIVNSNPPDAGCDPGYSVPENIFNKSRLDQSLQEQRTARVMPASDE